MTLETTFRPKTSSVAAAVALLLAAAGVRAGDEAVAEALAKAAAKAAEKAAPGGAEKVDFVKDVAPILESRCLECHGGKTTKARLRFATRQAALSGGKSGKAIVPGKPEESLLIQRVTLPPGDDDIMPAEGEPLSKAEIEVLRRWIAEGAAWPDEFKFAKAGDKEGAGAAEGDADADSPGPPLAPADEAKIEALRAAGASVLSVAQSVNWLSVSYRPVASKSGDAEVALLAGLAQVSELNLAGTAVTDAGLAPLASLVHLTRLHLERTGIQGSGLAHLKGLERLSYLNLYGTQVDDAAMEHLAALPRLKKLYLWQTKVTDEGVEKLKKALPDLYVNRGLEPPALAHPEPEAKAPEAAGGAEGEKKPAETVQVVLAAESEGWRFVTASSVQGDAWLEAEFDDAPWSQGKAPLGYGEPVIGDKKGTALELKGENILLRRTFEADEKVAGELAAGKAKLRLRVASDNSAIVWLNGQEVDRDTDNHEAAYWNRTVEVPSGALAKGRNVVAVLLHNNQGSSDAVLDLQLEVVAPVAATN
jgi:hypothetical protein